MADVFRGPTDGLVGGGIGPDGSPDDRVASVVPSPLQPEFVVNLSAQQRPFGGPLFPVVSFDSAGGPTLNPHDGGLLINPDPFGWNPNPLAWDPARTATTFWEELEEVKWKRRKPYRENVEFNNRALLKNVSRRRIPVEYGSDRDKIKTDLTAVFAAAAASGRQAILNVLNANEDLLVCEIGFRAWLDAIKPKHIWSSAGAAWDRLERAAGV